MQKTVLSIGQCGYDDSRLAALVKNTLGAAMESAESAAEARHLIAEKKYALVLVNRVFEDGESGLEFIRAARAEAESPAMMLISNYADAQIAALEAGAAPGFGKNALAEPTTADLLKAAAK